MARLLESADFAHSYPIGFDPEGTLFSWPGNVAMDETREAVLDGKNFIPLPCAAHTLELYHRLPYGWRTTPDGIATDLYMWQQILSIEDVRLASGNVATVLHFPTSQRGDVPVEDRLVELERWSKAAADPSFTAEIGRLVAENQAVEWARAEWRNRTLTRAHRETSERLRTALGDLAETIDTVDTLRHEHARLQQERDRLLVELGEAEEHAAGLEERIDELSAQVDWITGSRTWRIREAMLRIPGVAWLLRKAGMARSR